MPNLAQPRRPGAGPPLACLALLGLLAGCGGPESPFEMWDMRIGMTFAELDSISAEGQQARFTCATSLLGYRACSVPLRGSSGRMDALLDSADLVVELTFWTGRDALTSNLLKDGGRSYDMLMGLIERTQGLAEEWREVTASDTVFAEEAGWTETWFAGEGRWKAQIVWYGTGQADMIGIADAEAAYAHALAVARREAGVGVEKASGAQDGIRGELLRLVEAQRAFRQRTGGHADRLGPLHFIPRGDVLMEIGAARPAGWWARGWAEGAGECEVWDGVPPPRPGGYQGQAGEPVCS